MNKRSLVKELLEILVWWIAIGLFLTALKCISRPDKPYTKKQIEQFDEQENEFPGPP